MDSLLGSCLKDELEEMKDGWKFISKAEYTFLLCKLMINVCYGLNHLAFLELRVLARLSFAEPYMRIFQPNL